MNAAFWSTITFLILASSVYAKGYEGQQSAFILPQPVKEAQERPKACVVPKRVFLILRRASGNPQIAGSVIIWEPCK